MTILWPRLPRAIAEARFEQMHWGEALVGKTSDPAQIFGAVGGRASESDIAALGERLRQIAADFGFPVRGTDDARIEFDRVAAPHLRQLVDITWAEAGTRDMWSFVALVVAPDVTEWRFGHRNIERWVASDLTRHTWARLWWHAVIFAGDLDLLSALTESDLNQLLERTAIGGDPRLVKELARAVVGTSDTSGHRRELIRDATARLRRELAFVDPRSLDDGQIAEFCARVVNRSARKPA